MSDQNVLPREDSRSTGTTAEAVAATADRQDSLASPATRGERTVRGHIIFFFAVILTLLLAYRLRHALGIIYVSALFAVVLMPIVQQMMKLRIGKYQPSRTIGVVLLVLSVVVLLALFLLVGLPPVLHDIQHFIADAPQRAQQIVGKVQHLPLANKLGLDHIAEKVQGAAGSLAQYILSSIPLWANGLMELLEALILCIYFMLEGEYAYYYFLSIIPVSGRERLAKTLLVAETRMSKWLLGQGALMLILGVASTIVFACLHVRYFFLLGTLMGLFNLIPVIGGIITIVLAAGVASLDSWTKMAGVLIFYAIYIQIENAYLTPKIMKSSVDLLGLSVLVALLFGTTLGGVVGAMVAVPTAALIVVLADEYLVQKDPQANAVIEHAKTTKDKD